MSPWVFLVKLDSSFLIFNTTSKLLYFRSNVPQSAWNRSPKNHDALQEKVDAEESAEHQETNVGTAEEPDNTNFLEKETNVISGKTAMRT